MSVFLLILGLILFIGLVVIHEFGHFIMARRNGVEVEEFGIGFPPRAWSRKTKAGYIFSLNWLPIGGFVKMKGENDSADDEGSFGAASTWAKSKIMLAGVVMNLVVAFILFTVLGWTGMPQILDNQFKVASDTTYSNHKTMFVEKGSPAEKAGIKEHDNLLALGINGNWDSLNDEELGDATQRYAGQTVQLRYERDGKTQESQPVRLLSKAEVDASKKTDQPRGHLGVGEFVTVQSTWSAPVMAGGLIGQFTYETFRGLGTALSAVFQGEGKKAADQVSGPVGIVYLLKQGSAIGLGFILFIIAIISLTLTIMNILPIPALDGGRLYMLLLSRVFGKKLSTNAEEWIVGISFFTLIGLIILITIVDVNRFIL
jgi:regulator of sigma E protease